MRVAYGLVHLAFFHCLARDLLHAIPNALEPTLKEPLFQLDGDDFVALLGGGLGDPMTHQP